MYRDQRDALMARVSALDKELERRKKKIAEQGEDLEDTSERLEEAEEELADLRKKLARYEGTPKEPGPRPLLFIGIAGALVLVSTVLVIALNDEPTEEAPASFSGKLESSCDLGEDHNTHFDRDLRELVVGCVVPSLPEGSPAVSGRLSFVGGKLETLSVEDKMAPELKTQVEQCLSDIVSAWKMGEQTCEGTFSFTY